MKTRTNCILMMLLSMLLVRDVATGSTQTAADRSLLEHPDAWKTIASDGVTMRVQPEQGAEGNRALRIDFDFSKGAGYGGVTLDFPVELPENYEFSLSVRGNGPANNLELKLVDESGLNVWWVNRRAFEWPSEVTRLSNRKRHFQFAWGPSGGKPLTKISRIELIIAANEGGRGTVWIEDFRFTALPPEKPYTGTPQFSTSSRATDGGDALPWVARGDDESPWIAVDFGQPRDLGAIVIQRPPPKAPVNFDIEASEDGTKWTVIRRVRGATALPSEIALTDLQTRWLRLKFNRAENEAAPAVSEIKFLDPAAGASANALWRLRAARASRGLYPRTLLNEQSFWTVVGQVNDTSEALINEEGQVEVDRKMFSIEPFIVRDGGKLLTWADATHEQSLRDGWIPIPRVIRKHDGLELTATAVAAGEPGASSLHVAYTVRNTGNAPARGTLVLAVRPIQVLPPWQDLNITGGWTPIRTILPDESGLLINNNKRIAASSGFRTIATAYDAGDPVERLAANDKAMRGEGVSPSQRGQDAHATTHESRLGKLSIECPQKSASALLSWDFDLAPGASATHLICVPFHDQTTPPDRPSDAAEFEKLSDAIAKDWISRVDHVTFRLPESARQFHDTIRATQAYILINRDGNGFQPGSRTYERSWMRDGSMTSAAMLELGHDELVRKFIDWVAPYQFESGKVPCVVDRRGADPVPEHDSNGQLIWLIANAHRYTRDDELVRRHFERVKKTIEYIESLRAQRMTDEFGPNGAPRQEPDKPPVPAIAFRGLVPESISHEGYSAKPMHSFWDQLFVLRGLDDAVYLANVVNERELAAKWQKLADDFRNSVIESIRATQKAHGIDYLPGCVELGDFDSTSSTVLLWPVDEASRFPREWIDATFAKYWENFVQRRDASPPTWEGYTPYELRHVGTLVRLGQKDRAWEALDWYFGHQRPPGWRHWAEGVHRERTTPRMIGDMPHTWCGSDFLNAARTMFAYTDSDKQRLVLLAGVPDVWFGDPAGFAFEHLRTEFGGEISASAKVKGNRLVIEVRGTAKPPGGFELCQPTGKPFREISTSDKDAVREGDRVRFNSLPVTIELIY